jgi:hypothetical protein
VAGTIAAEDDSAEERWGVAGVNWEAAIMPLRFLGPRGGSVSDAVAALNYAVVNGARISDNSWGGSSSQALQEAIDRVDAAGPYYRRRGQQRLEQRQQAGVPGKLPEPQHRLRCGHGQQGRLGGLLELRRQLRGPRGPRRGIHSTLSGDSYDSYK